MSDRPQKQFLAKADLSTFGSGLLMELSNDGENFFDMVCVSGGFWKSRSHIQVQWVMLKNDINARLMDMNRRVGDHS